MNHPQKGTKEIFLERYYTNTSWEAGFDERVKETIFKSLKRTLNKWLPTDKSIPILDAACGVGTLLLFLKEDGYTNLHGFDLSPENVKLCHQRGLTFVEKSDLLKIEEWENQKYECIFLMDIIEHLPKNSVIHILQTAKEKLAPNGCIIMQTPNLGSVLGINQRYLDITHEFGVTERSIKGILLAAGFEEKKVEISASWNATTLLGYFREYYLCIIHRLVYLAEDHARPKIPTKNLLIRAFR